MSKKILFSLFIIALTIVGVASATAAYFSSNSVLGANTFKTGTVTLDEDSITGGPINLTNLTPGKTVTSGPFSVRYKGSIPADLYVGMKATSNGDLRDVLDYYIEEVDSNGKTLRSVNSWTGIGNLFFDWTPVASNVNENETKYYKLYVRMHADAGNEFQNINVSDDLIVHAVQQGFAKPTAAPQDYVVPTPAQN
jgi:predicted ribosomally synthesized peptide with SipW-like signal peptide